MSRFRVLIVAIACFAAIALLSGSASAAKPQGIMVLGEGDDVLVSFKKLDCKLRSTKSGRKFKATSESKGWELDVRINEFAGFHEYEIAWGIRSTNFTIKPPGGSRYYSNFFSPDDAQLPPFGGAVAFPGGRQTMGLGFIQAWASSGDDAVAVGGQGACKYPKKR